MRQFVLAVLVLAACRPAAAPGTPSDQVAGAPSPRAALDGYFAAVRAQDIQAMSAIWGNERGSGRTQYTREEYERVVFLQQCYLSHDQLRVLSGPTAHGDTAAFRIELRKGEKRAEATVKTIKGPSSRWYLLTTEPFPPDPSFCRTGSPPPRGNL